MTSLGIALFGASAAHLLWNFLRTPRQRPFPVYGVLGLTLILGAEILLVRRVWLVSVYFTPIAWTGYILAVDGAHFSLRGRSLLASNRTAFAWMSMLSVPLWLIFEAYNLRLRNWVYVGLPENLVLRHLGYVWAFATIWPAIHETAAFLLATQFPEQTGHPVTLDPKPLPALGAVLLLLPIVLPSAWAAYLFGLVWLGFALLIDPLNHHAGRASILGDLARGQWRRFWALLLAGLICGFFWEFWNYWATAKWRYIFPIFQRVKVFEMPLPGYLGFPAFALEAFAMYTFVTGWFRAPYHEIR